jgi:hypothetical protein
MSSSSLNGLPFIRPPPYGDELYGNSRDFLKEQSKVIATNQPIRQLAGQTSRICTGAWTKSDKTTAEAMKAMLGSRHPVKIQQDAAQRFPARSRVPLPQPIQQIRGKKLCDALQRDSALKHLPKFISRL